MDYKWSLRVLRPLATLRSYMGPDKYVISRRLNLNPGFIDLSTVRGCYEGCISSRGRSALIAQAMMHCIRLLQRWCLVKGDAELIMWLCGP